MQLTLNPSADDKSQEDNENENIIKLIEVALICTCWIKITWFQKQDKKLGLMQ
jgi:hypothetical protein